MSDLEFFCFDALGDVVAPSDIHPDPRTRTVLVTPPRELCDEFLLKAIFAAWAESGKDEAGYGGYLLQVRPRRGK